MAVVPSRRGRGTGSELLDALVEMAKEQGYEAMSLTVAPDSAAMHVFETHGFEKVEQTEVPSAAEEHLLGKVHRLTETLEISADRGKSAADQAPAARPAGRRRSAQAAAQAVDQHRDIGRTGVGEAQPGGDAGRADDDRLIVPARHAQRAV